MLPKVRAQRQLPLMRSILSAIGLGSEEISELFEAELDDDEYESCDSEEGYESSWESRSDIGDEQDVSESDSDSTHDSNAVERRSSVVNGHNRKLDESMSEGLSDVEFGAPRKIVQYIRTDDTADHAQVERESDATVILNLSPGPGFFKPDIEINIGSTTTHAASGLADLDDERIDGITIALNSFWT